MIFMSQKYSKIALEYLMKLDEKEPSIKHMIISWGDTEMMERLFDLFGGDRAKIRKKCLGHHYRYKYVMDRLDREASQKDAIFMKGYIKYPGIINRPTRCFKIIE